MHPAILHSSLMAGMLLRGIFFLSTCVVLGLEIADLEFFFNSTYIRREVPEWDSQTKEFTSTGFNPSWDLYKAHHVCIQKGNEGLFVGLRNIHRNWKEAENDKSKKHHLVSEKEWNSLRHMSDLKKNLMETYKAKRMDLLSQPIKKIIHLDEGTFFFNCEQNSRMAMTHGDWMVKHGVLYELAMYLKQNQGGRTFKYPWLFPFKHVFMNRCNNPDISDWNVAHPIMEVVKRRTDLYGLTKHGYTNYLRSEPSKESTDILCFENMYLSGRLSALLQGTSMMYMHTSTSAFSLISCMSSGQDNLLEFRRGNLRTSLAETHDLVSVSVNPTLFCFY